jgi:signal peptidase II
MKRLRYVLLVVATIVWCVGCDQATKSVAKERLPRGDVISVFNDAVRFVYAENPGGFLGLGASLPRHVRAPLFTFGVFAIVVAALVGLLVSPPLAVPARLGLALVCGGGASNLIDRIMHDGYVIDFLNVGVGGLRTGIFNIADMAIVFGALLVVVQAPARTPRHGG